jgi:hypothetical protein
MPPTSPALQAMSGKRLFGLRLALAHFDWGYRPRPNHCSRPVVFL